MKVTNMPADRMVETALKGALTNAEMDLKNTLEVVLDSVVGIDVLWEATGENAQVLAAVTVLDKLLREHPQHASPDDVQAVIDRIPFDATIPYDSFTRAVRDLSERYPALMTKEVLAKALQVISDKDTYEAFIAVVSREVLDHVDTKAS